MSNTASVSLEEYLNTSYEPDMDFVDGVLVERHVGSQRHGLLQTALAGFFGQYMRSHRIAVFIAPRLLVDAATQFSESRKRTTRHEIQNVCPWAWERFSFAI